MPKTTSTVTNARLDAVVGSILAIVKDYKRHGDKVVARYGIAVYLRIYDKHLRSTKTPSLISLNAIGKTKKQLVEEHSVPIKVVSDNLLALPNDQLDYRIGNVASFMAMVQDCLLVTLITKDEDKTLETSGLKDTMPLVPSQDRTAMVPWTIDDDPLSRYDRAGINVIELDMVAMCSTCKKFKFNEPKFLKPLKKGSKKLYCSPNC